MGRDYYAIAFISTRRMQIVGRAIWIHQDATHYLLLRGREISGTKDERSFHNGRVGGQLKNCWRQECQQSETKGYT